MKKSAQRQGHLQLHSALVIGHKEKEGVQRVYSQPFAKKKNQGKRGHHQDLVFVRPPGQAIGEFRLSIDSVWFCKVLLLFSFESRTPLGLKQHKCAFVSVLWEYEGDQRPGSNLI
jgi:hypothetical protein